MESEPLPQYLRGARRRLGLTQQDIALLTGRKDGTSVSRNERGTTELRLRRALQYALIYDIPVEQLFAGILAEELRRIHDRVGTLTWSADRVDLARLSCLPSVRVPGPRVLAVDRTHTGFAYACLEGSARLVEFASLESHQQSRVEHLERLLGRLRPDLLVLEERNRRTWRGAFTIPPHWVTRDEVRSIFASTGTTKDQIADELVHRFPELERKRPPLRRHWMTEDLRMNVFDAVSFALTALSMRH